MFSRGEVPFLDPGIELPQDQFLERLNEGERLKIPKGCHLKIYHDLLLPCWNADPKSRPDFDKIISKIKEIMDDPSFH